MDTPPLHCLIYAMDRLNSWARASDVGADAARFAIYRFKRMVIELALEHDLARFRAIRIQQPCLSCRGYRYSGNDALDPRHRCRRCNGAGRVELEFVETTIHLPANERVAVAHRIVWHTPFYSASETAKSRVPLDTFGRILYESSGNWRPLQTGRSLAPNDAARFFNVLEAKWGVGSRRRGEEACYELFVGRLPLDLCTRCGCRARHKIGAPSEQPATFTPQSATRNGVRWIAALCAKCRLYAPGALFGDRFPFPYELMTDAIWEWIGRHALAEESARPAPGGKIEGPLP